VRPQLGIVIFDSHAPIGTGQGVYLEATAEPVTENEVEAAMAVSRSGHLLRAGRHTARAKCAGRRPTGLYRARASRAYLGDRDRRIPFDFV
jgi:hypothetical protein